MFRRRSRAEAAAPDVSALTLRGRPPAGSTLVLPSLALIEQLLDEFGLKHVIDDDGDLAVRWEKCTIYFFFRGDHGEMLRARAYLNRWFDVDMRTMLTVVLDEWNRTRAMPKAFTVLPDEGLVGICGEQVFDFAPGATRDQIKFTVGVWIETLLHFAEWVDEQL
ncbi:MAG TPA: YbjN domain-containing protein [Jatrophihabitans sp.]|nr:YbjN domain-containing protein [Jatrophihabitans sp.]